MNPENILADTASLFLALGDSTRLRLLNLMRDREICVSSFTGTLGQSQPLISRHLAYLRNSGLVEARRDGKWIHYSISDKLDANTNRLLIELFHWMEGQDGLQQDRERFVETHPAAGCAKTEQAVASLPSRSRRPLKSTGESVSYAEHKQQTEPEYESESELEIEFTTDDGIDLTEVEFEPNNFDRSPGHNEIEDFLL